MVDAHDISTAIVFHNSCYNGSGILRLEDFGKYRVAKTASDLGGSPGKIFDLWARNRDFLHSDTRFFSFFRVLQYLVNVW